METWRTELYHEGIPGMKWGRRRFQNPDGSLTPAGRLRYGKKLGKEAHKILNNIDNHPKSHAEIASQYNKRSRALAKISNNARNLANANLSIEKTVSRVKAQKIDLSEMTDSELQRAVNRLNLERNYKELVASQNASSRSSASDFISTVATVTGIAASAVGIAAAIHELRNGS